MRKLKSAIHILLCVSTMLTVNFFASAESEPPPEPGEVLTGDPVLDAIIELQTIVVQQQLQIENLQLQITEIQSALSPGEINSALISLQISQSKDTEIYYYERELNSAKLLISGGELLSRQLILLDKQLAVEEVKLSLGETAKYIVDSLTAQRDAVKLQIAANDAVIAAKKAYLGKKSGIKGYEFVGEYSVSTAPLHYDKSPDELANALIANNATLWSYDEQIAAQEELCAEMYGYPEIERETLEGIRLEINRLESQRELYRAQLTLTALTKYNAYLDAETQLAALAVQRPILENQRALLNSLLLSGEISELEKLKREFEISGELYKIDSAAVARDNALCELRLAELGVAG